MRRTAFVAVAALLLASAPGSTSAQGPECRRGEFGVAVCDGQDQGQSPSPRGPSTPVPVYPFRELWEPVLTSGPNGTCVDIQTTRLGRDPFPNEDLQSELQFFRFLRTYSICPDAEIPVTTPAMEAVSFVRTIGFPQPRPHVAPGSLPVGFEAFLETGAPTTATFGPVATPFGDLMVTATAQVYVDWDDPHDEVEGEHGPYDGQPGPYPDGEIRHVYQYDGLYEIAVRYVWSVDWTIGGHAGAVPGIVTAGTYPAPGFEAFSRQAVG